MILLEKFGNHEPPITDSSAAQCFKACPRRYFFRYVLARVRKQLPPYIRFGSGYHKFREVFERTGDFKLAISEAVKLFNKKGGDPPVGSRYDFLTGLRLSQSCAIAYEHIKKEKLAKIIEVVSIEQPFNVQLKDETFTSGRLDQLVLWNKKPWIRDFKTTTKMGDYYKRTLEPNDQFTRYTFAGSQLTGERVNGVIVEVLYNTKKEGPAIHQYLAARTPTQVEVWEEEQVYWNMFLNTCRERNVWPMNETQCYNCDYHSVCKSPTEVTQLNRLRGDYEHKPWDNTKSEEEED